MEAASMPLGGRNDEDAMLISSGGSSKPFHEDGTVSPRGRKFAERYDSADGNSRAPFWQATTTLVTPRPAGPPKAGGASAAKIAMGAAEQAAWQEVGQAAMGRFAQLERVEKQSSAEHRMSEEDAAELAGLRTQFKAALVGGMASVGMSYEEQRAAELAARDMAQTEILHVCKRSCYIFGKRMPLRRLCLHLVRRPWFDQVVLLLIVLNSILMASENPLDPKRLTERMQTIHTLEIMFNLLFTAELSIKVIAFGLVMHPHTYLRNSWNQLDFVIVMSSWMPGASFSGARSLRLLRPLRSINRFPGLKRLVQTIALAIPQLGNVLAMAMLFFSTFAVIGVQLWSGQFRNRCLRDPGLSAAGKQLPLVYDFVNEGYEDHAWCDIGITGKWTNGTWTDNAGLLDGGTCHEGYTCARWMPESLTAEQNASYTKYDPNPYFGMISHDSFWFSFIVIFQAITITSWQEDMYYNWDTTGPASIFYYILVTLVGGYFILNLFVAVLKEKFDDAMSAYEGGEKIFDALDLNPGGVSLLNHDGNLGKSAIGQLFAQVNLTMSPKELTDVYYEIDADGGGDVDFDEFKEWAVGDDLWAIRLRDNLERLEQGEDITADGDITTQGIRKKLRFASRQQGIEDWHRLFEHYDRDNTGSLDFHEFKQAMRKDAAVAPMTSTMRRLLYPTRWDVPLQIVGNDGVLSNFDLRTVFDGIDADGNGTIEPEEFNFWLRESLSDAEVAEIGSGDDIQNAASTIQFFFKKKRSDAKAELRAEKLRLAEEAARKTRTVGFPVTCQKIADSKIFNNFFTMCILVNTVALAYDHEGIAKEDEDFLANLNVVLQCLFTVELSVKLTALTWAEFSTDRFNMFDFLIVALGWVDLIGVALAPAPPPCIKLPCVEADSGGSAIGVFRTFRLFRLFRVLRLITFFEPLKKIMLVILATVNGLAYIAVLIFLFMFIFTIMGMQLFGGKMNFPGEGTPRWHYDDFVVGLSTTFQVLTFDAWNLALYDFVRAADSWGGAVFCLVWIFVGAFVLLSMLLVIVLDQYVEVATELAEGEKQIALVDAEIEEARQLQLQMSSGSLSPRSQAVASSNPVVDVNADGSEMTFNPLAGRMGALDADGEASPVNGGDLTPNLKAERDMAANFNVAMSTADTSVGVMEQGGRDDEQSDKALKLFYRNSNIRRFCLKVAVHKWTDKFILLMIIMNCGTMALNSPELSPKSDLFAALEQLDGVFTIVFTVELSLKVIAFGLAFGPNAYLKSNWNRLDFFIVFTSWLDVIASEYDISALKIMRLLRAFRPLRMLTRMKGLQILVASLMDSVLALSNVLGVTMIVWLIFAIFGVNMFKGVFRRCYWEGDPIDFYSPHSTAHFASHYAKHATATSTHRFCDGEDSAVNCTKILSSAMCVGNITNDDGEHRAMYWKTADSNFDNVGEAMYTLYEISTADGWIDIMYCAVDATKPGLSPEPEYNTLWSLYFIFFIFANNFFFLNLFIGVIYENYVAIKNEGMELLTEPQKGWYAVMTMIPLANPVLKMTASTEMNPIKQWAYAVAASSSFDSFIIAVILFNTFVMGAKFEGESYAWTLMQEYLNNIFFVIFFIEMTIKIYAFSWKTYWSSSWNRFDFVVVMGSTADLAATVFELTFIPASMFRIFRIGRVIGRVARMFRVAKSVQGLNQIFLTLGNAIPALAYMSILIILILFVFSVLGMNLFGNIVMNGALNDRSNFRNAPMALMTLFGIATGDAVSALIHSSMVQEPMCDPTFQNLDGSVGNCGTRWVAMVYHVVFSLIMLFVVIEMFVNVIMEKFEEQAEQADLPITSNDIEDFKECWSALDPKASGFMSLSDLEYLLITLPPRICYEPSTGEDEVELKALRLPFMPEARTAAYLLRDEQVANHAKTQDDKLGFYEVLYALAERKMGTPLPQENPLVVKGNIALGLKIGSMRVGIVQYLGSKAAEGKDEGKVTLSSFIKLEKGIEGDDVAEEAAEIWLRANASVQNEMRAQSAAGGAESSPASFESEGR